MKSKNKLLKHIVKKRSKSTKNSWIELKITIFKKE